MSKPANICVFCGRKGVIKGHITPEWFLNFLPNPADKHQAVQGLYRTFTPDPNRVTPFLPSKVKEGRGAVKRLRKTCANCDNGWMSTIENEARPSLSLLIQGVRTRLDADAQKKIASLATLVTIRNEFRDGKLAVPETDRKWLLEKRVPPPSWKIWIARFSGYDTKPFWSNRTALASTEPPSAGIDPGYHTQSSTFVWGHVCCVSYSSSFFTDNKGYDGQLCRIWPVERDIIDSRRDVPKINQAGAVSLGEGLGRAFMK